MKRRSSLLLLALAGWLVGCGRERPADVSILAFTAPWCAACQADAAAKVELAERFYVTTFDVSRKPTLLRTYGVRALPTYVLYVDGREAWRGESIRELARHLGVKL